MAEGRRNNKTAGNSWERECVNKLKHIFPNMVTSRSESKSLDDDKIDLANKRPHINGFLPFEFQCKNMASPIDYIEELAKMPGVNPRIVLHKKTKKSGKLFMTKGLLAVMSIDDFIPLLEELINLRDEKERRGRTSSIPRKSKEDTSGGKRGEKATSIPKIPIKRSPKKG